MFPIRDHNPSLSTPLVTRALVLLNVLVWLYQWSLSSDPAAEAQFLRSYSSRVSLVAATGFHRLNEVVEHEDTPALRGMLNKISHLVEIETEEK